MSNFTNRLNALGEFQIGQAKFAILDIRGGWIKCAQTHKFTSGDLIEAYDLADNITDGVIDIDAGISDFPPAFVIPQTHANLDSVKATIADLDNQTIELCSVCVGNSVDPQTLVGACTSCIANAATIAYLKTV